MSKWSDGIPINITNDYYILWNNSCCESPSNNRYSLKQLFCLPDMVNQSGIPVDINQTFIDIAIGKKLFLAIKGVAGSGKTSLISYLCNNSDILRETTGIMVWTLPKSMDLIRIVMGECNTFAIKNNKKRMILVFENTAGYEIKLNEIHNVIFQRQTTLYPHISVIITYRNSEYSGSTKNFETLSIQPFSTERILSFIKKYESLNTELYDADISVTSLINKFDIETIGNPTILSLLVKRGLTHSLAKINTAEDMLSLLISNGTGEKTSYYMEVIAYLMFSRQTEHLPEEILYDYLYTHNKESKLTKDTRINPDEIRSCLKESCVFHDKKISFIHKSLYDYSLANYLFSLLSKVDTNNFDKNISKEIHLLFVADHLSRTTISFLKSIVKNTITVQTSVLVAHIRELFEMYLLGEASQVYDSDVPKKHTSFFPALQSEMNLFYNYSTVYHAALRACGSRKMFEKNNAADSKYMCYLKLFSMLGSKDMLDLSEMDFSEHDFSNISLAEIDLSSCNLKGCSFQFSKLSNVILKGSNLHCSDLHCVQLQDVDMSYANMHNARCTKSIILNSSLYASNFYAADLCRSSLYNVNCENANFHSASFDFSICTDVSFHNANLSNTFLRNAVFNNPNFDGADFNGAIID